MKNFDFIFDALWGQIGGVCGEFNNFFAELWRSEGSLIGEWSERGVYYGYFDFVMGFKRKENFNSGHLYSFA